MRYLLDTNAVSEWVKPRPDVGLVRWLDGIDEDRTYLSVLTVGELRKGVERLSPGSRKGRLSTWLSDELPDRFAGRILPVDLAVGDAWGRMLSRAEAAGSGVGGIDGLIAATAEVHQLEVVTRNVAHFRSTGVRVHCPWVG